MLGAADVHVEHIIPQKIKTKKAKEEFGDWVTYLGDKAESQHPKYVARIGNLTLFAGALNISASNNPFAMKEAGLQGFRHPADQGSWRRWRKFKFKTVEQRSTMLCGQGRRALAESVGRFEPAGTDSVVPAEAAPPSPQGAIFF